MGQIEMLQEKNSELELKLKFQTEDMSKEIEELKD